MIPRFHVFNKFLCSSPRSWSMWAGTEQGEQQRKFKGQKTQYQKQRQRLQWQQQSVSLSSTTEGPTKARVPQRSVGSHMLYTASIWQQSSMQADGQSLDWSGQRAKPALRSIYGPPNVSTSTLPWVLICMTSGYFCVWSSDAFQQDLLVLKTLSTLKTSHISPFTNYCCFVLVSLVFLLGSFPSCVLMSL